MTYQAKPLTNIGEIRHRRREEVTYRNGIFKGAEMVLELKSKDKRLLALSTNLNLEMLNGQQTTVRTGEPAKVEA